MSGQIKLIFVEDEADIRLLVIIALGFDEQIEVTSFGSGEEALDHLRVSGELYDLALLDVRMPHMDGIGLHQGLRKIAGMTAIPSILLTASTSAWDRDRYEIDGIIGIIQKPFDPLSLAQKIRSIFETAVNRP